MQHHLVVTRMLTCNFAFTAHTYNGMIIGPKIASMYVHMSGFLGHFFFFFFFKYAFVILKTTYCVGMTKLELKMC